LISLCSYFSDSLFGLLYGAFAEVWKCDLGSRVRKRASFRSFFDVAREKFFQEGGSEQAVNVVF